MECNSISSYKEKYQGHIPCSFAYKVVCIDNRFFTKEKMSFSNLLKQFLPSIIILGE